jgi:hypothetical protein
MRLLSVYEEKIRVKVKEYFRDACENLDRQRYSQESAYVDAFIARLDGKLNIGPGHGVIRFTPTIVADRGAGSAESKFGADFAIVFQSKEVTHPIRKAIISQAKNGMVSALSKTEQNRLAAQCRKMARITDSYIVLEAPVVSGAMPTVKIGDPQTGLWERDSIDFDDYFLEQILSCKHGDRRESFIDGVADSKLSGIKVDVNDLEYTPKITPRKRRAPRKNSDDMEP